MRWQHLNISTAKVFYVTWMRQDGFWRPLWTIKLLLKCKILKFVLDFSLFQKEKRMYDEKKARRDWGKKTRGQEKDITEVKSGRDKSSNEEGQETRTCMFSGKGRGRESQVQKHVNTEEIKKYNWKEGGKVKESQGKVSAPSFALFQKEKSPFPCLRVAAIMTLQKSIWQFLLLAMSSVVLCCIHGCTVLNLQYLRDT